MPPRKIRVAKHGAQACQSCGTVATLRSLDVAVPARAARRDSPAMPAGWAPLIALCGICWTDVRTMLRAAATPDSSGSISPP